MEYTTKVSQYTAIPSEADVAAVVADVSRRSVGNRTSDVFKTCFSCIDLTALNTTDSRSSIGKFASKAVDFRKEFPYIPDVASICVYPSFVDAVGLAVGDSNIAITSVSGGFPSSQTYIEVKMLETAMAVENGADEIDIVLSVGEFLDGQIEVAGNEIETLAGEVGEDVVLKVIIESGELKTPENIYKASILSMCAGADFVKTSTGKVSVSATPEAAVVMCFAIRDFYEKTGRKVGFKAAGGVRTADEAVLYYTIVESILGQEWLTPSLFRIGASSLANNLLSAIEGREVKYY